MDLSPEGRAKRIVQEYLKRSQGKVIEPNKIVVSPLFSLANDVFRVSLQGTTDLLVKIYHAGLPEFTDNTLETQLVKKLSQEKIYPEVFYTCTEFRIQHFVQSIPIERDNFGWAKLMLVAQKMADFSCQFKPFVQLYNNSHKIQSKFTLKSLQATFWQIHAQKMKECPQLVEQCREDIAKVYGNEALMNQLSQLLNNSQMVLSHNDCHLGNFLDNGSKLYILDYEFSQFNYLGFDLGNFLNEWATEYGSSFQIKQQLELPEHLQHGMIKIYFQGLRKAYNIEGGFEDWGRHVALGRILSHLFWMSVGLKQIDDKRIEFSMVGYVRRRQEQLQKRLSCYLKMEK